MALVKRFLGLLLLPLLVLAACGEPVTEAETPAATSAAPVTIAATSAVPTTAAPAPTEAAPANNGELAREHLEMLSDTLGPAVVGTPAEAETVQYLETVFEGLGYTPQQQSFEVEGEDDTFECVNVIAVKPGLSSQEIIVGAHYDAVDDGAGADDNASGVAVLLEVAAKLQDVQTPYTVRFIAFGAEEVDLNGSRYYVDQLSDDELQNIVGMINLDSLIAGDITYVYGDAGPLGVIRDWIMEQAENRGFEVETEPADNLDSPDGTPCDCADYAPFEAAGIPFAYFEATNWNLGEQEGTTQVDPEFGDDGEIRHTKYDTIAYLDETFPGRIDEHFNVYVTLLYDTLTQFKLSD